MQSTSRRVGIMASLTGPTSLEALVDAAVCRLEANGFDVLVLSAGRSAQDELAAWETIRRSHCEGIIVHSDCLSNDQLARLVSTHRNVVLANLCCTQIGRLAADHLLRMRHEKLALVTGPGYRYCVQHVTEGFLSRLELADAKRVKLRTLQTTMDRSGGATAMKLLLDEETPPTAAFFMNDRMAIGALEACKERDIHVPDEFSILGCGDLEESAYTRPALSTLRHPLRRIGEHAAERAMCLIDGVTARSEEEDDMLWGRPSVVQRYTINDRGRSQSMADRQISARERECLNWAAKGKTSWEISQILGVTESTIIYHLRNATRKLNAANRLHAVAKALEASIIDF